MIELVVVFPFAVGLWSKHIMLAEPVVWLNRRLNTLVAEILCALARKRLHSVSIGQILLNNKQNSACLTSQNQPTICETILKHITFLPLYFTTK